jgi:hypothetical protein
MRIENCDESGPHSAPQAPAFKKEWEQEYLECTCKLNTARAGCLVGASWLIYDFSSICFSCGPDTDVAGGSSQWIVFTYVSEAVCSVVMISTVLLFSIQRCRGFCIRNYDGICIFFMTIIYASIVLPEVLLEFRRSLFQWDKAPQINWHIDYGIFLPSRSCNDTDPARTWQNYTKRNHNTAIGCNNLVLSQSGFIRR